MKTKKIAAQIAAEGPRVAYSTQERSPLIETALGLRPTIYTAAAQVLLDPSKEKAGGAQDAILTDAVLDDSVLDIVESLIGPDIALWSSHFIAKPAGVGKRVPWHEDSAYWGRCSTRWRS